MLKEVKARQVVTMFTVFIVFMFLISEMSLGVNIPIFILLMLVLAFMNLHGVETPVKKSGWLFAPVIFALSIPYAINTNFLFKALNLPVIFALFILMSLALSGEWNSKTRAFESFIRLILRAVQSFMYFLLPFKWISEKMNLKKHKTVKSVLIGLIIAIPLFLVLLSALSSADMVFGESVGHFLKLLYEYVKIPNPFFIVVGIILALFSVGLACATISADPMKISKFERKLRFDSTAALIVQFVVAAVYAVFTAIQFKYLFGESPLPFNLSYAEYARNGFFDLVGLSLFNFSFVLLISFFARDVQRNKIIKALSTVICAETFVMLASSFYRMWLYEHVYGYTVLRLLVYSFLVFEAVSLTFTVIYIYREKINIAFAYAATGLVIYLVLNFVNLDAVIAKRNIDVFVRNETAQLDVQYLTSLSYDAIPVIVDYYKDYPNGNNDLKIYLAESKTGLIEIQNSRHWQEFNFADDAALAALKGAGF